jgi:hypothetical protein
LEEFQAAHGRIFKAMDADHDGTVTLEEMQAFHARALSRSAYLALTPAERALPELVRAFADEACRSDARGTQKVLD